MATKNVAKAAAPAVKEAKEKVDFSFKIVGDGKSQKVIIELPIKVYRSKSGLSDVIASTKGALDTGIEYKGKNVQLNVNAYVKIDED